MSDLQTLMTKETRLVVGLMTGTSTDGVDAVLAQIEGSGEATSAEVLAHLSSEIPAELRGDLFTLFMPDAQVEDLCRANFALGEVLANAALAVIEEAGMTPEEVDLIGSHGQTVRHLPAGDVPSTLQIGEPAVHGRDLGVVRQRMNAYVDLGQTFPP